jgi:hypothetical protein
MSACLVAVAVPTFSAGAAGSRQAHVVRTSCATMGLSTASLGRYFGSGMVVTAASYECGVSGHGFTLTAYLWPLSQKAEVIDTEPVTKDKIPLGGLGAGADLYIRGDNYYVLNLTRGAHFVELDVTAAPSQGKLINLARIVFRAL